MDTLSLINKRVHQPDKSDDSENKSDEKTTTDKPAAVQVKDSEVKKAEPAKEKEQVLSEKKKVAVTQSSDKHKVNAAATKAKPSEENSHSKTPLQEQVLNTAFSVVKNPMFIGGVVIVLVLGVMIKGIDTAQMKTASALLSSLQDSTKTSQQLVSDEAGKTRDMVASKTISLERLVNNVQRTQRDIKSIVASQGAHQTEEQKIAYANLEQQINDLNRMTKLIYDRQNTSASLPKASSHQSQQKSQRLTKNKSYKITGVLPNGILIESPDSFFVAKKGEKTPLGIVSEATATKVVIGNWVIS